MDKERAWDGLQIRETLRCLRAQVKTGEKGGLSGSFAQLPLGGNRMTVEKKTTPTASSSDESLGEWGKLSLPPLYSIEKVGRFRKRST